ncbi:acetyl-CoA carboxylase biotin carboxylase subunit [Shimia thalassica]|uniref:acetyl/propionyl/methylcrotonyl-CoA carboxylase subunit alpha n=1 Tax=Shimia thalassica TaxID=1715693 RepID=UPI00273285D2|nr:acetyl-CoA carboxylase biotin carboxylase subunit [Shimia thalassica]MDP2580769.1 acetyl-CoA carboxylase biotin carboxylase subunit [Shimia thalassica]
MTHFDTVLVANRGEIALRVMRTARDLGLQTVAVFSEADADAPHVRFADQAVCIGPAPATDSYLNAERILQAAARTGAGAIHPGYGFLSENADFARAVAGAGLVFIGPSPEAIEIMGDKAKAKRLMIKAGVPCVPGYEGEDQNVQQFVVAANKIGFPVMVKAAAGGGGKGMRLVHTADELPDALQIARAEALNAFGSDVLILEKAVLEPRHVEIQVFGDADGTVLHLGERDCSVQRRHQKVIEEAPSPAVDPALRDRMGQAAIAAAKAVNYVGAGTVEFLLEPSGAFYFLEMNTRLQVEHPVTEMVTGVDLVALQLRVASGLPLDLSQNDVAHKGHAIEVRLYAEDPAQGFLPSAGPISLWHAPDGQGLRIDGGIETGGEVSAFYDPMLAKVIGWGATREVARRRVLRGLQKSALFGPASNRDFLIDALSQPEFVQGEATTGFIGRTYGDSFTPATRSDRDHAIAAVLHTQLHFEKARQAAPHIAEELLGWSSSKPLSSVVVYHSVDEPVTCRVTRKDTGFVVSIGDAQFEVTLRRKGITEFELVIDGDRVSGLYHQQSDRALSVALPDSSFAVYDCAGMPRAEEENGLGLVTAPMHGRLLGLSVAVGETIERGQKLAVLEAMKMQHEILAAVSGTVSRIEPQAGQQMAAGDVILEIVEDE